MCPELPNLDSADYVLKIDQRGQESVFALGIYFIESGFQVRGKFEDKL